MHQRAAGCVLLHMHLMITYNKPGNRLVFLPTMRMWYAQVWLQPHLISVTSMQLGPSRCAQEGVQAARPPSGEDGLSENRYRPLKMVARHFMLSLCQLTPLNLEEPLPVGALLRALGFTVTVSVPASPPL